MIDAFLGGLAYGLGVTAYMWIYDGTVANGIVGAFCFSVIVMAIPFYNLDFFLGRPGLLSDKNIGFFDNLAIFMGNFLGLTWMGLFVKVLPAYGAKITANANYALNFMANYSFDTNLILSIYAGMMFYAGAMACRKGYSVFYFMLINLVCLFAQWPTMQFLVFSLWADSWKPYGYLMFPVVLGNILGANIWVLMRRHSPKYKNKEYITQDAPKSIADKIEELVLSNSSHQDSNKDNHSDK